MATGRMTTEFLGEVQPWSSWERIDAVFGEPEQGKLHVELQIIINNVRAMSFNVERRCVLVFRAEDFKYNVSTDRIFEAVRDQLQKVPRPKAVRLEEWRNLEQEFVSRLKCNPGDEMLREVTTYRFRVTVDV